MLQESFPLIFKLREIEILKNMPVKIWLPVTCHIKLFPDNFKKKSPSLVGFALTLKKLLTSKVAGAESAPPPPTPRSE